MRHATNSRPILRVTARRTEVVEVLGPHRITDPYRWLEDSGDPETTSWLAAQQALYLQARDQWRGRGWFLRRLEELTAFEECSPPVWRGSRAFYSCRGPDDEHPSLRTRDYTAAGEPRGRERTIIDPMRLDPAGRTTLDAWTPSQDGHLVACLISADGTEQALLRVLDTDTGAFIGSPISNCRSPAVAWLPGPPAFFYVGDAQPGNGQPGNAQPGNAQPGDAQPGDAQPGNGPRVRLHEVGAPGGRDPEVFGDGLDKDVEVDIVLDDAGQRLLVTVVTDLSSTTDIWLVEQPAARIRTPDPGPGPLPGGYRIAACPDGWSAAWPGRDGRLYLLTDHEAPRGQIVVADAATARTDPGRTLIPEDPVAVIESMAILDDEALPAPLLVLARSRAGHTTLSCHDCRTGHRLWDIPLPGDGIVTELSCRQQGGHEAWFSYTDTLTPPTVYRYDATSRSVTPWRQPEPPEPPGPATVRTRAAGPTASGAGPHGVRARGVQYPSADGTPVRMLLTMPGEAGGPLPAILHAYGAFGESQQAEYYELGLAWAQSGGLLAIPCVRGGGEEGESWHQDGMLANKQRGIDDLIAAAEYLIETGLAEPSAIGVKGFSAGGLLAAAAFIQRPDLFAAAECTSPLLDMARYELSGLGSHWSGEFGRRDDPEELGWMLGYSPYHNVTDGTGYPAVLLATFDGDARVDPMHARKMCAALQHATSSPRPVLLRTEPGVGHGARSRSALLGYFADVLAFFARHLAAYDHPAQEQGAARGGARHDQEV